MHDARIEVHVRVEIARNEILVFKRNLFQGQGKLEDGRIMQPELIENFVAGFAHELGSRIVVLVDTVTEPHQAHAARLVLDLLDEVADFRDAALFLDVIEHRERRFVGAAVLRAPQTSYARSNGRKGTRTGTCAQTYGRS